MATRKKQAKKPPDNIIDEIKSALFEAAPGIIGSMVTSKLTGQKSSPVIVFMTQEDFERAVRRIVRDELDR